MTKQLKELLLRQMDESVRPWIGLRENAPPRGGWVKSIRQALGMSAAQLGNRMGLSRQGVADLERREAEQAVTLAVLENAARAMNAKLVYAIVPRESLEETVRAQARAVADKQLRRVAHTMRLEAQDVSSEEYANQLAESTATLLANWSRYIWDEEDSSLRK